MTGTMFVANTSVFKKKKHFILQLKIQNFQGIFWLMRGDVKQ